MPSGPFQFYQTAREYIGNGTINLGSHTFKAALYLSTSNAGTLTNATLSQLTNQHANANGYTTGGVTLSGVTWIRTGSTVAFDSNDAVWTASGGSIIARRLVIYRDGTVNGVANALLVTCLLDNAPADVTATAGNQLIVQIANIFTKS
jgi:hypothetical protein